MDARESLREAENLRFRFQMNSRLRLECLAAVSKVFREYNEPIADQLLSSVVFALPQELVTSNGRGVAHLATSDADSRRPDNPPDKPAPPPQPGNPPNPPGPRPGNPPNPPRPGNPPDKPRPDQRPDNPPYAPARPALPPEEPETQPLQAPAVPPESPDQSAMGYLA